MSPWEFKVGQIIGYKPRGEKWRARVTAMEEEGKPFLAEIPIVDEDGSPINYDSPPSHVNPILDHENYVLIQNVNGVATDPWLAARLDHEDPGGAWKVFAEKIGIKEPYYQALAMVVEKWAPEGQRGDILDDMLVLLHAAWRAGACSENRECERLVKQRCNERGIICLAHCTHQDDIKAIKERRQEYI